MIRSIAMVNAAHAKSYYTSALQPTEYYVNQQELEGRFGGQLARTLNIQGAVDRETFFALLDNKHPATGEKLTARNKDHRIVGWDVSFHAPKGVSLAHVLSGDTHISDAFEEAVEQTLAEMEQDAMTRIRKDGKDTDRYTGKLLYASFLHQTARPAKGAVSDPHLHRHNVILNLTVDPFEDRYKALQIREINRSLPYFQSRFHKRFSDSLMALGYQIKHTSKGWDIAGIPSDIVSLFSKRANEIGIFAAENNITNPKTLDQLGAKTRGKKQKDLSMTQLKAEWRRQIREASAGKEDQGDKIVRYKGKIISPTLSPQHVIEHATQHSFERLSTISDRRLLESAYRFAIGNNSVSVDDITSAFDNDNSFLRAKEGFQTICTTKTVLAEERDMVNLARNGQGKFNPLYRELPQIALEGEQRLAVEHVLSTRDLVSIIRGVAGAGKTTALLELDTHIKAAGKQSYYFAPTGSASRDNLVQAGFKNATTLAALFNNRELQEDVCGQIIIVDEIGLTGTADMRKLLSLATRQNAKVVMLGDEKQHRSVARGQALKVLKDVAKLKSADINKIRRQRTETYRSVVQDLSQGKIASAFENMSQKHLNNWLINGMQRPALLNKIYMTLANVIWLRRLSNSRSAMSP